MLFTARKRSLEQGNIFAPVCHSNSQGGGVPGQVPPRQVHPSGTPLGRYTPWQVHPPGTPVGAVYLPGGYLPGRCTCPGGVYLPGGCTCPGGYLGRCTCRGGCACPGRYTPSAGTPPGSSACWEIRATSGRYASHWNAFLFKIINAMREGRYVKSLYIITTDKLKKTPLIHAVLNGHAHVASYLLSEGANPNAADSSGNTCLHYAAAYGWYFCLKLLLDVGANPNVSNDWKVCVTCYRPQRSCGQGNIFTPVCHSVHGGGGLPQCMLGYHTPLGADTPPPEQTPSQDHTPRTRHPPGPDTPWDQLHPHPPGTRYTPLD